MTNSERIKTALSELIGLRLALATSTGNMCRFHFGELEMCVKRPKDTFALHLSSPWRIEAGARVLTGSGDYYTPADETKPFDADKNEPLASLQDYTLHQLMRGFDADSGAILNHTDQLVVLSVGGDEFGGAEFVLSGDYRLHIFPTSSRDEAWRLLPPQPRQHFVIWDGEPELH